MIVVTWILENFGKVVRVVLSIALVLVGLALVLRWAGFGGVWGACASSYRSYRGTGQPEEPQASGYTFSLGLGPLGIWEYKLGMVWLEGTASKLFPFPFPRIQFPTGQVVVQGFPWQDSSEADASISASFQVLIFDLGFTWSSPAVGSRYAEADIPLCV